MTCDRCHGLMVSVTLEDIEGTVPREPTFAWRCLICGEVTDPTIAENRVPSHSPLIRKPRPRFGTLVGVTVTRDQKPKRECPSHKMTRATSLPRR